MGTPTPSKGCKQDPQTPFAPPKYPRPRQIGSLRPSASRNRTPPALPNRPARAPVGLPRPSLATRPEEAPWGLWRAPRPIPKGRPIIREELPVPTAFRLSRQEKMSEIFVRASNSKPRPSSPHTPLLDLRPRPTPAPQSQSREASPTIPAPIRTPGHD